MLVIIGALVVTFSVIGGFMMAGGHVGALVQPSEFVVILGAALGALIIMAPKKVLLDMVGQIKGTLKGSPYNKAAYEELLKALYELFMLGRRNGMIALEEHVLKPEESSIFTKYPKFLADHHAVEFLCGALRPVIDGKVKPDQLKALLEIEMDAAEEEHHQPVSVLTKTSDAMPGFGIVAAVLGIVVTMASIGGPVSEIGHHVAAALVGTFLGILVSYGYISPLVVNIELTGAAHMAYTRCLASAVVGFANGMAPLMAVEVARRGLSSDVKPTSDQLEEMLKSLNAKK